METTQTTQAVEKQEQDESSDDIDAALEKRGQAIVDDFLKQLSAYTARFSKQVLEKALANVTGITDAADKLNEAKERLYQIYDNSDIRTRYIVAVLLQVQSVNGICSEVDFGSDVLYSVHDSGFINYARCQLAGDPDLGFLNEIYELSKFINDSC